MLRALRALDKDVYLSEIDEDAGLAIQTLAPLLASYDERKNQGTHEERAARAREVISNYIGDLIVDKFGLKFRDAHHDVEIFEIEISAAATSYFIGKEGPA